MDMPQSLVSSNDSFGANVTYGHDVGNHGNSVHAGGPPGRPLAGEVRIPLYSIIFFLAVAGNTLVIVTLAQNRRMRTVTNVFLINLSVSDLLLAVFCMPFTLIPTLLQNFIFGKAMCVLIRYMQAVSVSVSVFTLVAISFERYFAICQPLRSRSWQTLSHSYKIIVVVWFVSMVTMIPVAVYQRLKDIPGPGTQKCVEDWDNGTAEKAYTIFLDFALLVMPLIMMLVAYGKIAMTLWKGIKLEMRSVQEMRELRSTKERDDDIDTEDEVRYDSVQLTNGRKSVGGSSNDVRATPKKRCVDLRHHMRHSNTEKSLQAKKRVIRMLFVLVVEFFVCWAPTYILQSWYVFDQAGAMARVTPMTMNLLHLLSYVSSCCNPITYCFMNRKFRQGFMTAFHCCPCAKRSSRGKSMMGDHSYIPSQRTGNDQTHALRRLVLRNTSAMAVSCGFGLKSTIIRHSGSGSTKHGHVTP